MREFNTEGPVVAAWHYCVPPLERVDLDQVLGLIRARRYCVLHAPRQTGKTSTLLALRDLLNGGAGEGFRCVYANVEVAQTAREDVRDAMQAVLGELANRALEAGDGFLDERWPDLLASFGPHNALATALSRWSMSDPRPLVVLIDEIDALIGDTLIAVLRQLRAGYDRRPRSFPQSVVLCGVRDVRDYRIRSRAENAVIAGGSAFNIRAESLRLGDFTEAELRALLTQHTTETGQAFTAQAVDAVWMGTRGQPWLVNALCRQACFGSRAGRDRSRAIGVADIFDAREHLIESRQVHLDQLVDKLQEDRVRRVIEPLLSGASEDDSSLHDLEYVRDLGLIARDDPPRIANPIYAEVVPRELTYAVQAKLLQDAAWYVDAGGGLDVHKLLASFQAFFREHSEHWVQRFDYREAGPQLLLQAFLQRIVNGGGRIEREYGLGRGRTDLLIVWPRRGGQHQPAEADRIVIECKVLRGRLERTIADGLAQTAAYMDRCAAREGHLVVFDRAEGKAWEEKMYCREESVDGRTIAVWGM
ncbi:MAG: AAA family ATPase [Acidobacteria bacterium]|nr:AAA family ATPase [Acidobacteriota bacterium]